MLFIVASFLGAWGLRETAFGWERHARARRAGNLDLLELEHLWMSARSRLVKEVGQILAQLFLGDEFRPFKTRSSLRRSA